ncbi:MAG TPA: ATP-binding protein [Polyangiales bacterium]
MSPLATLCAAFTAVYAYLCAYYSLLYVRRRAEREYLAFGLLSGAMAVYALGAGLYVDAGSLHKAIHATELSLYGQLTAAALYVDFAHHISAKAGQRMPRFAYALSFVGGLANLAGLLIDGSRGSEGGLVLLRSSTPFVPLLTGLGSLSSCVTLGFFAYGTFVIMVRARTDGDARIVLAGALILLLTAAHDLVLRLLGIRSVYLLEHSYLLFALTVSYVLLERFVRTANALTSRTLELRRSFNELRDAQEQLLRKEQLATMGELSAVIAHEVRNPLAIIKNAVSGLHRPTLRDSDRQVLLKILDEEADRLNRLVGDLLAYARPVTPQRQSVQVEDLVRGAVELARAAQQRDDQVGIEVVLEEQHTIQGDPDLLRQALVNVAENAIQAMPDGGTLTVRTYGTLIEGLPAVAIAVRDTGEGMDTLVRSKATDPFFTTRPTGTGLGLAIVHRLVHSHGGKVQIESSYGTGTTVTLILPEQPPARTTLTPPLKKPSQRPK